MNVETELARELTICNACRYCEGMCPAFGAMARRLDFTRTDLHYLANLCHGCGACLHSCQYAPPHEFAVRIPRAMADVRHATYAEYAWPRALSVLYARQGVSVALSTAVGIAAFLLAALAARGTLWHPPLAGDFYAVFPHQPLILVFGAAFGFAIVALTVAALRFHRALQKHGGGAAPKELVDALHAGATLRYFDSGHGDGCTDADDRTSHWRRRMHHATFYGFLLCFAATTVATAYHYLGGWPAPYPVDSVPVLLGIIGGLGLILGPAGLLFLRARRHPDHLAPSAAAMDVAFILLLLLVSITGFAVLIGRDGPAMALLLAIHLGCVAALFLTLPYGKFAHGVYRLVALAHWASERRRPALGSLD